MSAPDERHLLEHLDEVPYQSGAIVGHWGRRDVMTIQWPNMVFWVKAVARDKSPDRFHLKLDCAGYPEVPPTGTFCDAVEFKSLPPANWPRGTGQVSAVFRLDWNGGSALYHPYDRAALNGHSDWKQKYPHLVWTPRHTIVHVLSEFHRLLNSSEYTGVQ